MVTDQIVQLLIESELVVADLTGANPNVYYELALRHATRKPCVQMIDIDERLPFDIAASRTIIFDINDLNSVVACKRELSAQLDRVLSPDFRASSPISRALDIFRLQDSRNPLEQAAAETMVLLGEIRSSLHGVTANSEEGHSDQDFLTLRRAIRDLWVQRVLPDEVITHLRRAVQVESPMLGRWLSSMAGTMDVG